MNKKIKVKSINNKQKGLSLVGVLIAITIISLSLMAGLEFMSNALRATSVAKHEVMANFLAEEGIELTKNIYYRSNLQDGAKTGYQYLDNKKGQNYIINYEKSLNKNQLLDPTGTDLLKNDLDNAGLCLDETNGFFNQCPTQTSGASGADFIRMIKIEAGGAIGSGDCENGLKIISHIFWSENWDDLSMIDNKNQLPYLGGAKQPYARKVSACIFE